MENISREVGQRIRLYRQACGLTLADCAGRIHKSKSTLSKYETGEIAIDVQTLFELSAVLEISPHQLLAAELPSAQPESGRVLSRSQKYLYLYDGRAARVIRSLLEMTELSGDAPDQATLFYNISSFEEHRSCRALYTGTATSHDFVTNYSLVNRSNGIENLFMCIPLPLDYTDRRIGLLSGISSRTMLPVSAKCLLSDTPLPEDEALLEHLLLSREDQRLIKKCNMFVIEQML